jgi:pimeloyl-ACP methyl ester carboxylesterase
MHRPDPLRGLAQPIGDPEEVVMKPTIVLVHGAFAESASWNYVVDSLVTAGHPVIAAANPLRALSADAASVGDLIRTVEGPVVLVGHSCGRAVISNVAEAGEITGLVYVAAFAPEPGESCISLAALFPGSTLGDALQPIPRSDGTTDLYIIQDRFHDQFCADVPAPQATRMAATQRPVRRRHSSHRPASGRHGASCRAGSCSAKRTATSPRSSSASWPSVPEHIARSRSPARRMRSASLSLRRRLT